MKTAIILGATGLVQVINSLLVGRLKKYRSINPETIAKTMVWLDNNSYNLKKIPSDKINALVA